MPYKLNYIKQVFQNKKKVQNRSISQRYYISMYIPYPLVIPIRFAMSKQVHKAMYII